MKIDGKPTKFELGQLLYLRANMEFAGVVSGLIIRPGLATYLVTWGDHEQTEHLECELLAEKAFINPE